MNYLYGPEETAFRDELQSWLEQNTAADPPDPSDEEAYMGFLRVWHQQLAKGGWVGLSLPIEAGGRGLPPLYDGIFNEELALADAPPAPRNVNFLARALVSFGTSDQRQRFLPGLLSCEVLWCQGFSEPGAGSDLASLRTRAVLDGDEYVLNGQKVWTTFGKWADWCLVLARTDPDVPKHKGISALAVEMESPGISVRPLHLIDHSEELSEVFFDEVRVPANQLIGYPGDGWKLAMRTLAYERGPAEIGALARNSRLLLELERRAMDGQFEDVPYVHDRLARTFVKLEVLRLHVLRSLSARGSREPGPEGSVDKLLMAHLEQDLARLHFELTGTAPLLGLNDQVLGDYLHSRAMTIYGGAEQIQRNILAQRVLGMPVSSPR